jgi:cytochrome P450
VATHPEVEDKLLQELRSLGLPCNGNLEDALAVLEAKGPDGVSAQNMPYMAAVLNEAMRMYPAGASASPRCAAEAVERACLLGGQEPAVLAFGLSWQLLSLVQPCSRSAPLPIQPPPSRLTEKPTKVGPYMLPKGVIVFPCLYVINNWSGNWEEPRKVGRLVEREPRRLVCLPEAPLLVS